MYDDDSQCPDEGFGPEKGYIAFLDLLGFEREVLDESFPQKFRQYSRIIAEAVYAQERSYVSEGDIQFVVFSDSAILAASGNATLDDLVIATANILYRSLTELHFPIRGCISTGSWWAGWHESGDVCIAGRPIIDAYRYEQRQDWVGVMLSPEVLRADKGLASRCYVPPTVTDEGQAKSLYDRLPLPLVLYDYNRIPLRGKPSDETPEFFKGLVVVPLKEAETPLYEDPIAPALQQWGVYRRELNRLLMVAPDSRTQRKYGAAGQLIETVSSRWGQVLNNHPTWKSFLKGLSVEPDPE